MKSQQFKFWFSSLLGLVLGISFFSTEIATQKPTDKFHFEQTVSADSSPPLLFIKNVNQSLIHLLSSANSFDFFFLNSLTNLIRKHTQIANQLLHSQTKGYLKNVQYLSQFNYFNTYKILVPEHNFQN